MRFTIVPATMMKSAWRGDERATSQPKRAMSKRAAPSDTNSMPQQLVAKVSGQIELLRPQLISLSSEPTITLAPLS